MIDLGNRTSLERLHKAKKNSRDALVPFQRVRTRLIEDYVGSWYSQYGSKLPTLINKLNQTARIYQMALAANNPQCKVTSFSQKLWPFARKYETNINRVIANIDLKTTLQAAVLDAFFLVGIAVVRLADAGFVKTEDNVWVDPGKTWVDRISLDNAILDLAATDIRAMRFYGHRYRASWRKIKERDDFEGKIVKRLAPSSKNNTDQGTDPASQITAGWLVDDDELEPMCWLEDIFLPENQQWVTFSGDNPELGPLKVLDWEGEERGPYKYLSLGMVPDNILPSSPVQNLKGLHDLANRLYRKCSQQAQNQKTVTIYKPGAEKDAELLRQSKNGDYIQQRNPDDVKQLNWNGVDGNTNLFFQAALEVYNTAAGNERSIGGLGTESNTVGQEQQIAAHAGGLVGFMKNQVIDFTSDICREVGSLMWDSESLKVESEIDALGTGYHIDSSWQPGKRQGLKDHYEFKVAPNSMAYITPEMKLQKVYDFLNRIVPLWPMIQAGAIDVQELTTMAAEYMDVAELPKVFKLGQQVGILNPGQGASAHQASKPPVTTRNVVRTNNPTGGTAANRSNMLAQAMAGGMTTQGQART
jgi:hypothetical protein